MLRRSLTAMMLVSISFFVYGQNQNTDPNCQCVTYYNCFNNQTINKYGVSVIDVRLGEPRKCENLMDVCCTVSQIKSNDTPIQPLKEHVNRGCGYRNRNGIDFRITGDVANVANEGEFPWMVLIMRKETVDKKQENAYKCGGALIHRRIVLTAAHCIDSYSTSELLVRAGEWDTSSTKERLRHQDRKINTIIRHPQYDGSYLGYDFALLMLTEPFNLADNVEIVCLPEKNEEFDSKDCYVTGWGKNKFGQDGIFSSILKAVKLPMVPSDECQERLRETRLSKYFELHPSFVCAGGIPGYDACEGDGGSPLVCPSKRDSDRYVEVGIVAWGIGCNDSVPAAYAKVSLVRPWVDATLKKFNILPTSYVQQ